MALASVGVAALLAGGFGIGVASQRHDTTSASPRTANATPISQNQQQPTTPQVDQNSDEPVAEVAKALSPAVVQIEVKTSNEQGLGSGFVYDASGLIMTNAHVVSTAKTVKVRTAKGELVDGQVLGADEAADVAVVKIDHDDLTVARLADGEAEVGQTAVALGSPFGLEQTVTAGIVSAVDRPVAGGTGASINMIQTDAPINPGNSGGPLANKRGEVIGMDSSIYSETGQNNGIGFAIPIVTAKAVADKIVNGESLDHGYLGVSSQPTTDGQAGAQLAQVSSGSPADKAGLQTGDVITSIDGAAVKDPSDLSARIITHSPGDKVTLEVDRDGQTEQVTVELGTRPAQLDQQGQQQQSPQPSTPRNRNGG